ncbi:MAG: hypothetical protein ACI8QC_001122 [Planctomycetota bacterium]|jgi:hypothetical protein
MLALALSLQEPWRKAGFGEQAFHGQTTLHPLGFVAIVVLGLAVLSVPRKYAALPFVLMACFVSPAQRIVIATLDFNLLRLLVLAGWLRLAMRGEYTGLRWRKLDNLVIAWGISSAIAYILLRGTFGAFVFRAGQLYDIFGMYLFFRCVIRGWADVDRVVRFAALLAIPMALLFALEKSTGRNSFAFLGGVPPITIAREGRLRCQGPFPHAILAGCFFAAWLPMVFAQRHRAKGKARATLAVVAMVALVIMCSSSTPLVGVMAGVVGALGWLVRYRMQVVRWMTLATLVSLHMVMEAPVWHLISRISFSRGSTSYHRYLLIENAINHFNEWALLGSLDTGHWGHAMYDLTNQYVREGVKGGFLALIFFVWAMGHAFLLVGRLWRSVKRERYKRSMAWALGVCLFVHGMMFLSISITHSQQNMMVFFLLFAAIGSLAPDGKRKRRRKRRPQEQADDEEELDSSGKLQLVGGPFS